MLSDSAVSRLLPLPCRRHIQALPDGTYEANLYDLSFPVIGESGNFPVRTISRQGEECRYFRIDPALMQQADN